MRKDTDIETIAMEKNLLERSREDLDVAELLWKTQTDDEIFLNTIGYHLQQSVEKLLKWRLEEEGIPFPRTHDIDILVNEFQVKETDWQPPEWLEAMADTITNWESRSRYPSSYLMRVDKIRKVIPKIENLLSEAEDNGL